MVAALVLVGVAVYALWSYEQKPPRRPRQPVASYVAAEGKVEARPGFDVNVGTGQLNGKVEHILVKEGESVRAGQVVAVLQNEDARARVVAAEQDLAVARSRLREVASGARKEEILEAAAALEGAKAVRDEAERLLRRYAELYRQGMVSPAALDERERAFRAAQAGVEEAVQRKKLLEAGPKPETLALYRDQVGQAEAALDYNRKLLDLTVVHAPISGVVIQRYLAEGEGVTPEIPILDIADLDRIWINAEVDETAGGKIKVGDPVEITSEAYPRKTFRGRIERIADYAGVRKIRPSNPAVNLGLKVVQVKIALLEKTPLKLGMTVDVRITPGRR